MLLYNDLSSKKILIFFIKLSSGIKVENFSQKQLYKIDKFYYL